MRKVLIANRGEIAARIIRTCREMGLETVAIYADQDRDTLACQLADSAYSLGGEDAASTYLDETKILQIAARAGADAIHPGYGFLAESQSFAASVEAAGLTWIGPGADAIAALGDKIAARALATRAGVGVIPGFAGDLRDPQSQNSAAKFAEEIGFPIVIKRADAGGGRGITRIDDAAALDQFFCDHAGDTALAVSFVEKLMQNCRHIETQCLRDRFGNFHVASTRDCTVQRRNQKMVEEAPARNVDEECLGNWSEALFTAANYIGVGTCEFLVDPAGRCYFLEVNPRLQVEHTVTEEVTGLDLVATQIRIARGEEIEPPAPVRGAAIEVRITAEDPARDLLPATGQITRLRWCAGPGVRVDTFVETGTHIGAAFDSLIGKITVLAADRAAAIARLSRALGELQIAGIPTCTPILDQIINHPDFAALNIHTRWYDTLEFQVEPTAATTAAPAVEQICCSIEVDGRRHSLKLPATLFAGQSQSAAPARQPLLKNRRRPTTPTSGGADALAPMQATLVRVPVQVGDTVQAGQLVAVIEAMKMESFVTAPVTGRVREIPLDPGSPVKTGQLLVGIDSEEEK